MVLTYSMCAVMAICYSLQLTDCKGICSDLEEMSTFQIAVLHFSFCRKKGKMEQNRVLFADLSDY